jgi:hypothetical protein
LIVSLVEGIPDQEIVDNISQDCDFYQLLDLMSQSFTQIIKEKGFNLEKFIQKENCVELLNKVLDSKFSDAMMRSINIFILIQTLSYMNKKVRDFLSNNS